MRHRQTLIGLEGETYHVDGPDPESEPEVAAYYAKAPERWRGRYFVYGNWGFQHEGAWHERRVFEMVDAPPAEDGTPVVQWTRVTDPALLEKIR